MTSQSDSAGSDEGSRPGQNDQFQVNSTAEMTRIQVDDRSLRLLVAQRRMHDRSKRWTMLRYIGLTALALGAPVLAVVVPSSAVVVGAISGVWLFLSRVVFRKYEREWAAKAAATQEQFDHRVFGMNSSTSRTPLASLEDIARLTGSDDQVRDTAGKKDLVHWYPFDSELSGDSSVAIAQRANAIYSENLLKLNARIWLVIVVAWAIGVLALGLAKLDVTALLLGIVMPILPALLDVIEQYQFTRRAAADRRKLADAIESQLRGDNPITSESVLVWQDQMHNLRRESPQVPNIVYKAVRTKNEQAMHLAADQLAQEIKAKQGRLAQGGTP